MSNVRTWSFKTGRGHFNRVTVFQRGEGTAILIHWWRDGERNTESLGHADKDRAVAQAMAKALELKGERPTHEPTNRLMAMRSDLARCAALQGCPPGYGPGWSFYRQHGAFKLAAIGAAFRGYRAKDPADTWTDALHRFGFKPRSSSRRPTKMQAATDVRRVAALVGQARRLPELWAYNEHGRWCGSATMKALDAVRWRDVADILDLDMEEWRKNTALKCRGMSLKRWSNRNAARVADHPRKAAA